MKFKLLTIFLSIIIITSCEKDKNCITGQGALVTKTLNIASFTGVDLAGAHNIIISQGLVQEVKATGHSNIIDRVKTQVKGGIWESELIDGCYNHYELTIYITVPNINIVRLTGSGNIIVNNFDSQGNLVADLIGSGNINFKEFNDCEIFIANIIGSGNISGYNSFDSLENLNINIIGSGNFNGFPMETEECIVNIEGSGNCYVSVEDLLDVTITGSGNVYYKGFPSINVSITGSGRVINSN